MGNFPAICKQHKHLLVHEIEHELTLGETRTEQTRDLLDQSFGTEESVVLLGQLLDELLVLVQPERAIIVSIPYPQRAIVKGNALFQVVNRHILEVDLLRTIDISRIGENANVQARTGDIGKS